MTKKQLIIVSISLLAAFGLQSCRKKGCTDKMATNYEDEAKKDDGSCEYVGRLIFWYNQATEDSLFNRGYSPSSLTFQVNGKLVDDDFGGTNYSFSATPVAPNCPSGFFAFSDHPYTSIDMGNSATMPVDYKVTLPDGSAIFQGSKSISGGNCNDIELKF